MDIPTEAEIRYALIARIQKFSDEHSKSYSEIGGDAIGDRNLWFDLNNGRSLRISTYHRVIAYLDSKPKPKSKPPDPEREDTLARTRKRKLGNGTCSK